MPARSAFIISAIFRISVLSSLYILFGCGSTWSTSSFDKPPPLSVTNEKRNPDDIMLTEDDIGNRPYQVLGDISVTVNKTTIFNQTPTREMVNEKLKLEAAKLGADAVIHVRYGTGGISLMSWGSLDGKGRAIIFSR